MKLKRGPSRAMAVLAAGLSIASLDAETQVASGALPAATAPATLPSESAMEQAERALAETWRPRDLLAYLDHESPAVREIASRRLLDRAPMSDADLTELFAEVRSHEQRLRLLEIAYHHTLSAMIESDPGGQGSLGIYFKKPPVQQVSYEGSPVVVVQQTLPGMPAHARLQPGDQIVGYNGRPWPPSLTQRGFNHTIGRAKAGESLRFTVRRSGRVFETEVPLADVRARGRIYHAVEGVLALTPEAERRWTARRAELLEQVPKEFLARVLDQPES